MNGAEPKQTSKNSKKGNSKRLSWQGHNESLLLRTSTRNHHATIALKIRKPYNMSGGPQQQVATLLERGIGIWPTQLPRADDGYENTSVRVKEIDDPGPATYGNWQELVHPLGGTYYYNNTKNAFTPMNLRRYLGLHHLEDFIDASRAAVNEDTWILVVLPTIFMGEERFQYYYVVPDQHIIAWLEDLNGELLFGECIQTSEWRHKRLELEAQYWKHFEFFPHQFQMDTSQVRRIQRELFCYIGGKPIALQRLTESPEIKIEATILGQSSAASMFWTIGQMGQVGAHLTTIEGLVDNGIVEETGVVFCYRVGHHQFLNRHNQPEARLIRGHAVRKNHRTCKLLVFMGNAAAMVLCMPITIDRIKSTSVDGVLNGVEVNSFINDFSSQAQGQITLAGVSIAMDIAILAIPGLGATEASQVICSCALLFGVGCIFAGTMLYYLQRKTKMFIVITGIPTSFCVLRITGSVTGSILGFLSGVATDFKPSAPVMIASLTTLGVVSTNKGERGPKLSVKRRLAVTMDAERTPQRSTLRFWHVTVPTNHCLANEMRISEDPVIYGHDQRGSAGGTVPETRTLDPAVPQLILNMGQNVILQIQQYAGRWAIRGIVTVVFTKAVYVVAQISNFDGSALCPKSGLGNGKAHSIVQTAGH
ncbi:hypothetical protein DEU56DRAFT_761946 [Suillus clintonianus]|uniref:uncharacterized protein n=1 Tax=Suillus clintonianus TaxID=1904413 RepID=UPI001B86CAF7|nr:uncharacterized protein DEU56DRAFT_761946 [Suillus clintonianus]KAG2113384.1 hypothetical protein DEU56DRAFT_761946 [Suillus clintonianus]